MLEVSHLANQVYWFSEYMYCTGFQHIMLVFTYHIFLFFYFFILNSLFLQSTRLLGLSLRVSVCVCVSGIRAAILPVMQKPVVVHSENWASVQFSPDHYMYKIDIKDYTYIWGNIQVLCTVPMQMHNYCQCVGPVYILCRGKDVWDI